MLEFNEASGADTSLPEDGEGGLKGLREGADAGLLSAPLEKLPTPVLSIEHVWVLDVMGSKP